MVCCGLLFGIVCRVCLCVVYCLLSRVARGRLFFVLVDVSLLIVVCVCVDLRFVFCDVV